MLMHAARDRRESGYEYKSAPTNTTDEKHWYYDLSYTAFWLIQKCNEEFLFYFYESVLKASVRELAGYYT